MQFMSWASTLRRASRIMLTARAMLVSRYKPSGIMPTRDATVASTESRKGISRVENWLRNISTPRGTRARPMKRMSLSRERIISPLGTACPARASWARRLA